MEKMKVNNARTSGWCSSSKRFFSSSSASGCKRKTKRRRKISGSSSGCYLPFDLITQVLIRLPMKSVLRFGCVSKQWHDLTSSAPFKNLKGAHQLSQEPSKLLLWDDVIDYDKWTHECLELQVIDLNKKRKNEVVYSAFKYHKRRDPEDSYYASSCHGLVCFAGKLSLEAFVLNPITRQDVKILLPEHHGDHEWANRIISIGFLPCTQQFKIVCWAAGKYLPRLYSEWGCEVLTFNTKTAADTSEIRELSPSWTSTMRMQFNHSFEIQHTISICIGGVIYWLVVLAAMKAAVLAFDLEKEEARIIPGPQDFPVYKRQENVFPFYKRNENLVPLTSFIELRGALCIVGKVEKVEIPKTRNPDGGSFHPSLTGRSLRNKNLVTGTEASIWMLTKKKSQPDDDDDAVYHWYKLLSNVVESGPPTREVGRPTREVVFLNVESRKFHYLHIHNQKENKKKKSIKRFGDGPLEVFDLALIPNTFNLQRSKTILFSESFNFLC